MEVCKKIDVLLSNIHIFGVTPAEHNVLWRYLHVFVVVTACRFFAVISLLHWRRNGMQLKHTHFPDLKNMGTLL